MEGKYMGGQWTDFVQDSPYQEEEPAYEVIVEEGMFQLPFEEIGLAFDYEANYKPISFFEGQVREPAVQQQQEEQKFMQQVPPQEADNEWIDIIETEHGLDTQTRHIPDELEVPAWGFEEDQQRLEDITMAVNKNLHNYHDDVDKQKPRERLTQEELDFQAAKKKKKHKPSDGDYREKQAVVSTNRSSKSHHTVTPTRLVADGATPPAAANPPPPPPPPPPAPPSLPINTQPAQPPKPSTNVPPAVGNPPPPQPPPPPPAPPPAPTPQPANGGAPGGGLPGMHHHAPGGKPSLTDPDDTADTETSTTHRSFFETTMMPYGYETQAPVAFPSAGMPGNFGGIAQDLGGLGQIGAFHSGSYHDYQMNSVVFFLTFLFAYTYVRL